MPEVTVTCGCTRRMRLDPLRGRGAYVCGCGARVKVEVSADERPHCFGMGDDGMRCPFAPVHASAFFGIALCKVHYENYLETLDRINEYKLATIEFRIIRSYMFESLQEGRGVAEHAWAWSSPERALEVEEWHRQSVVYYVRIRDTIKIGTTVNTASRIPRLGADEVLALEPGGEDLERLRHRQFAHLRIRGERFRAEPDLLSHIEMLVKHFGKPVRTEPHKGQRGWIYESATECRLT